ncbi:MAG: restriction endonuclease subunit S [Clostridiaceae bacterium]|nr:restriction endonuclease subunit S [Clostridiaceae bacterium]MBW4859763.1 restriction endonuclease subunit S [Clostridiaceae bacterium]MBW4869807.1 restriction endonuclease subunit S [Clostridiaceae bacterium]
MAKKTIEQLLQEALIPVEEQLYDVPENWVWSSIDYVTDEIRNGTTIKQNKDQIGIKVTRIESIQNNSIDFNRIGFIEEVDKLKEKDYYQEGDIALSHINSIEHIGKTALIKKDFLPLIHGMNLLRLRFNKKLYLPEFMAYYTQGIEFKYDVVKRIKRAVNQVSLNQKNLKEIRVTLPPLSEQQRIVTKIESLFSKIDKAKELIEEVRGRFENRKAAILAKAFRGELTEKWREENLGVKSGKALFKDIEVLKERLKSIEKNSVSSYDLEEPFDLPNTWIWIKLGDICYKFKYGSSKKSSSEGTVPVLRMGNLQGGKLDWSDLVYTSDEDEIKKYKLLYNDILFNRTNSPELVGKTSIYKGEMKAIFAGYLIRIRPFELIDNDYINYFLNSTYAKYKCYQVKTDGVSQSNINSKKLGEFEIPIPPLEEQEEIVRILDNLLSFESKIEKLTELEEQIELLKKSILAKAFRGELGTNDPTEESAIGLLKEVLKEKINHRK